MSQSRPKPKMPPKAILRAFNMVPVFKMKISLVSDLTSVDLKNFEMTCQENEAHNLPFYIFRILNCFLACTPVHKCGHLYGLGHILGAHATNLKVGGRTSKSRGHYPFY